MQTHAEDPALQPPLDEYRKQLRALQDDARELVSPLDPEQLNWAPAPGKWSVAECLDHLDATARSYIAAIDPAIEEGHAAGKLGGGAKYGFFERWFIRSLEPPPKRGFKAPGKVVPRASTYEKEEILERFVEGHEQLVGQLARADGLDLGKVKIKSPLASFLRFRLGAAFAILIAHGRRHLWQARGVVKSAGFPSPGP